MRMRRPDRTGNEPIVVEDSQVAERGVVRIEVRIEAEMPIGAEPPTLDVLKRLGWSEGKHRHSCASPADRPVCNAIATISLAHGPRPSPRNLFRVPNSQ